MTLPITAPPRSHLLHIVRALYASGWKASQAPTGARLQRNGQPLMLCGDQHDIRLRLFVYKVTGSSRGRPDERRIEITSTYQKGLRRRRGYRDVVLGYDAETAVFVGVDPRRIAEGGPTGNASSFFDRQGLTWRHTDSILVLQREATLPRFPRGVEFHAFVKPARLPEYLFNVEAIHEGSYSGTGDYSASSGSRATAGRIVAPSDRIGGELLILQGPASTKRNLVSSRLVQAVETGRLTLRQRKKLTPAELQEINRRLQEVGRLGEEFVLQHERRALRRAGRADLAGRVRQVSLESVAEGYDVLSYKPSGDEKWIEVKLKFHRLPTESLC